MIGQKKEMLHPALPMRKSNAMERAALSRQYYNLFVLENETYTDGSFSVSKTVALQKYTAPELLLKFRSCPPDFPAYIGKITEIIVQGQTIKFRFSRFRTVRQRLLNENPDRFSLLHAAMRNELDEEHWAIKSCDLIKALEEAEGQE